MSNNQAFVHSSGQTVVDHLREMANSQMNTAEISLDFR